MISTTISLFFTPFYLGSWLNTTTLILFTGLGACIALKSGCMNLGGESQVYIGGFICALWLNHFLPSSLEDYSTIYSIFVFTTAVLVSLFSSALTTALCALLKSFRNIHEMISTFLLSAAFIPILDNFLTRSLRNTTGNLAAMPPIHNAFILKTLLEPSAFNISFFIALSLSITMAFFFYKTDSGNRLLICGTAPEFANYCGYSTTKATLFGLSLSGGLHAITGIIAVCGTYYTCHRGFYAGLGWNGLTAALIARSNPLVLIITALFLSLIFTLSDAAMLSGSINFNIESLVQGCILLFVSARFLSIRRKHVRS